MIPYRMNPMGITTAIEPNWRNFYDNPITWTEFNALNFSQYASVRIELDFTTVESPRGTANYPIFGRYGGDNCPLFISYAVSDSALYVYMYQSTGRYVLVPTHLTRILPGQQSIVYTMTPGSKGSLLLNGVEKLSSAGTFSGYPTMGSNISSADCTIQRIEVFGDNALIWKAAKSDLTI